MIVSASSLISDSSSFNTLDICNQLREKTLKISLEQTDRILKIAEEVIKSSVPFLNQKKEKISHTTDENTLTTKKRKREVFEQETDLNDLKIQFFKNDQNNEIKIYLHKRISKDMQAHLKKGSFKVLTEVFDVTLNYGEKKFASISKKAKLQLNNRFHFTKRYDKFFNEFAGEIKFLKKFKGKPNICQMESSQKYMGTHKNQDVTKIVMYQHLYKGTLDEIKKENLSVETLTKIFKGCLKGLEAIHKKEILHADIKPQNILLDEENNPYITDFGGSAKIKNWKETRTTGTPSYFSPEKTLYLFRKINHEVGGQIGAPADIWALGCSISSLITHSLPLSSFFIDSIPAIIKLNFSLNCIKSTDRDTSQIDLSKISNLNHSLEELSLNIENYNQYLQQLFELKSNILIDYTTNYQEERNTILRFKRPFLILQKWIENINNNSFPPTENENAYIQQNKELILAYIYNRFYDTISTTLVMNAKRMKSLWELLEKKNVELANQMEVLNSSSDNKVLKALEKIFVVNPDQRITIEETKKILA